MIHSNLSSKSEFFLCTASLLLVSAAFITFSMPLLAFFVGFGWIIVLRQLSIYKFLDANDSQIAILLGAIATASLAFTGFKNPVAIYHFSIVILSLLLALRITRNPVAYVHASAFTVLALQAFVGFHIAREGWSTYPLETLVPGASSNGITSLLFVIQFNYTVSNFILNRKPSLITAAITLAICFVGFGRGSMIAAAALLCISVVFSFSPKARLQWLIGLAAVAAATMFAAPALVGWLVELLDRNTKLGTGLVDQHRLAMIVDYISAIDGMTLFAGASFEGTIIETRYNGNPHNSFIRAHKIFGLLYLFAMLLLPLYLIARQRSFDVKIYLFGMFAVLMFRAFSEPILFPTPFDLYYFSLCIGFSAARRRAITMSDRDCVPEIRWRHIFGTSESNGRWTSSARPGEIIAWIIRSKRFPLPSRNQEKYRALLRRVSQ